MKYQSKKTCFLIALLWALQILHGQSALFSVNKNTYLPTDTNFTQPLLRDLNRLLAETEKGHIINSFVLPFERYETALLLDEIQDIRKSTKYKDTGFYKCYLINVMKQNDSAAILQLAYIGYHNDTSYQRALVTLLANKINKRFYFHSTLKSATATWKTKTIGHLTIHYRNSFNKKNAGKYFDQVKAFDTRLKAPDYYTRYYVCENFYEVMQLSGLSFLSDYNSYARNSLISKTGDTIYYVNGIYTANFNSFDPHDLWHARLHYVISTDIINRPVDEGTACLYGGSWGLSWEEILKRFKAYATAHQDADWLREYNESTNFDPQSKYPLNADHIINALIVKKIEQEKGFDAVKELLSCGKKEKDNENYFRALEKITGINKTTFNTYVWALIKAN